MTLEAPAPRLGQGRGVRWHDKARGLLWLRAFDDVHDRGYEEAVRHGTDGVIELFVVLREGAVLDDDLRKTLARAIRERCSPRHVPDKVRAIKAVPRTLSGKVVEVPTKRSSWVQIRPRSSAATVSPTRGVRLVRQERIE